MTPEEIIEAGQKALNWILDHKITVALTVIFVTGITVVTVSYVSKRAKKYETAWSKIGVLSLDMGIAGFQDEKAREETFTKAIAEYKSMLEEGATKKVTPWILFGLGNAQYSAREYTDAIQTYKRFLDEYGDHPLVPFVRQSIGYASEEKGHLDAAIMYLQGNAPADDPFLMAQEKWDLGRCYEKMGRKEEAVKAYDEALELAPESQFARLSQYRLDCIQ
ncbi:MAG: tol-pal system YbgF family protein [Candidatus Brocadiales bacterium]